MQKQIEIRCSADNLRRERTSREMWRDKLVLSADARSFNELHNNVLFLNPIFAIKLKSKSTSKPNVKVNFTRNLRLIFVQIFMFLCFNVLFLASLLPSLSFLCEVGASVWSLIHLPC